MKKSFLSICLFAMFLLFVGGGSKPPPVPSGTEPICEPVHLEWDYTHSQYGKRKYFLNFRYCLIPAKSENVMYFMHGTMGSETAWHKKGIFDKAFPKFRESYALAGEKAPKVVVVSLGNSWILNDRGFERNQGPQEATLQIFVEKIMPYIEQKHALLGQGKPGKRLLSGISMGGQNALQLYFHYPEKWARASLVNPAIPLCDDPWGIDSASCWQARVTNVVGSMIQLMANWENQAHWKANNVLRSPLLKKEMPPLQIHYALQDEFKFTMTNIQLVGVAEKAGIKIEALKNQGDHGDLNVKAFADFMTKD